MYVHVLYEVAEKLMIYTVLNGDGSLGYSWMHSYPNTT
jgi:hypothetical protein